jgi:hypothetical protein
MDPRQTAIRLSKLSFSTAISDLTERKTFTLFKGRLRKARCNVELEATLPLSHLRRCTARCSEAAAHHDICSSSCSLPCELCLSRVGCLKPCPHEDFRESRIENPSAIISSAHAESGSGRKCPSSMSPLMLIRLGEWGLNG